MWSDNTEDNAKDGPAETEGNDYTTAPGDEEPSVKFHASTSGITGNRTYLIIDFRPKPACL